MNSMFKKSFVALATLLCGAVAFATPGAYTEWFSDAVPNHPTGWTNGKKVTVGEVSSITVTTDAAVTYTAADPATAYAKQTVTVTSEPLDELPLPTDAALDGARFAFGVAQLEGDAAPAVYVLAKVDGVAKWTKTSVSATAGATTAVEVTYDKVAKTFTVKGDPTVFTSLIDDSADWTQTSFVGNGAVNALVGAKAGVGVAMIEGVGYDTLEAAIAAAGAKTIDLTANVTLPATAANYKINTNGFTVDTPAGYITSVNGSAVAVTAASGAATDPSFLWNNDFTVSCVDVNQTGWSFYKPSGVSASETGMSVGANGGSSLLARTKNATIAAGVSVVLRAKGLTKPASGNRALIRVKNGDAVGVSVNDQGQFVGIAGDSINWGGAAGQFIEKAADVERTFVLTYVYNQTVKLYELIGARTVAKVWEGPSNLTYSSLNGKGFNEIALLGMWNSGSFSGATMTGLAIFNGTIITAETMANLDWASPAPNKATYAASDVTVEHFGYLTGTKTMIWPGLTLDDIKNRIFTGTMNGSWVDAASGADSGKIGYWSNCPTKVEKTVNADSVVVDFQRTGDKDEDKFIRVTLTEEDGGIKAVAQAGTSKGGSNSTLATDDTVAAYGLKYLSATKPVVATIDETPYYSVADALAAVVAAPTTVAVFVEALAELPVAYVETCVLSEDGLQAWAKRDAYVTTEGNYKVDANNTVTTLREGDTVIYHADYLTANRWRITLPTTTCPIVVNWQGNDPGISVYGIPANDQIEVKTDSKLYLQGSQTINAGVAISGAGTFRINSGDVGTVSGTVTISAVIDLVGTFKLADGAMLKTKTELAENTQVTTEVTGKRVAKTSADGYFVYTLEAISPTPGVITVAQGGSAQEVEVTVPVSNAEGQTVTLVVKDKDGTTLPGTHTGTVTGGQAVITITGAVDTGYTFEASIGGTSLGEGTFFTGIDNVWFAASAVSGVSAVTNGAWNVTPAIDGGKYVINDPEGNRFVVDSAKQGEGDGKLAKIVQVVTFTSAIEVADLPAIETGTVGGLTVAQDGEDLVWKGVKNGEWTTLAGATPALDTEYTVTVEYDRRGASGVFTYKVGEKTLGVNTVDKTTGFSGVTAMGTGKLAYIEATAGAAVPVAEGYVTAEENGKPIRVDNDSAAVFGANREAVQAKLLETPVTGGLKVWEAYALGATAAEAKDGVKPVISGAQTSDTDKMKIVDGFTVREHTGIAVTRKVLSGTDPASLTETTVGVTQEADGVSVALPAEGAKAKYIKIEYSFE